MVLRLHGMEEVEGSTPFGSTAQWPMTRRELLPRLAAVCSSSAGPLSIRFEGWTHLGSGGVTRASLTSPRAVKRLTSRREAARIWRRVGRRATARLSESLGRTPTPEEVARMLGLARKKLPIIKKAIHVHQNAPQTEQAEGGWSLGELVRDENAKCPAEVLLDHDTMRHVLRRIDTLDERAAKIIRLRFGLGGVEPMTLKEIGTVLGLTRERVRQIESETLASLAVEIDAAPRARIRLRHGA